MGAIRFDDVLPPEELWLLLAFLLLSALVVFAARGERRQVLRLGALYAVGLLFHGSGAILLAVGTPRGAAAAHLVASLLSGVAVLGLLGALVFGVVLGAMGFRLPRIVRDVSVALACLAYFLWLLSTRHVDVAGIVATSAVLTAVIGLSLQDFLSNVMGGLGLQLDALVGVGDWVTFGEARGVVREISWRHTSIETTNGDTYVVPNSVLMKTPVLLIGKTISGGPAAQRRWVRFLVEDRVPPTSVVAAVGEALRREPIPNVAAEPAADVVLLAVRDGSCEYAVRYWLTDMRADDRTDSTVRIRIWFALKRAEMPFAIPVSNIHLWSEEGLKRRQAVEAAQDARRKAVERIPVFAPLTPEEKERLAEGLLFTPFAAGEAIVRQGAAANHLFVLTKGLVEVRVEVEGAAPRVVATLRAPDVFGEMGLLTGEPRKATVVALEETECWRVTKEAFHDILAARPALAEEISSILAQRDVELADAREGLSEEAKRSRLSEEQVSLLSKMRDFFGLSR